MNRMDVFNKQAFRVWLDGRETLAIDFSAATQAQAEEMMDAEVEKFCVWGWEVNDYRNRR